MTRLPILLLALLVAAPAAAADRTIGIGSFERVRVDGPFEVRIATGTSPAARIAGDRDAIEAVDLRVEGGTLVLRRGGGGWGERPAGATATPIVVTLGTPMLTGASVGGAGRVTITRMKAMRVDLSVTGAGAIVLGAVEADQLNATVIGAGTLAVAGRAARVRLVANGPGTLDAAALDAADLTVRLEGNGVVTARARFTAQVSNAGLGSVTVTGPAKCVVRPGGGPVACGR